MPSSLSSSDTAANSLDSPKDSLIFASDFGPMPLIAKQPLGRLLYHRQSLLSEGSTRILLSSVLCPGYCPPPETRVSHLLPQALLPRTIEAELLSVLRMYGEFCPRACTMLLFSAQQKNRLYEMNRHLYPESPLYSRSRNY